MPELDVFSFYVTSMVGRRTGSPGVTVTINGADLTVNMSPEDARSLAKNLLQAAAAAENDAFFVDFLRRRVGTSEENIVGLLAEFREWKHRER